MKVAYMIGALSRGGTETLLYDMFQKVNLAPFDMLLIHRHKGPMVEDFQRCTRNSTQCAIQELGPKKGNYIVYLLRLRKLLIKEKVSIVHAQFWMDCIFARIATIGLKVPVMMTFHGYFLYHGIKALPIKLAIWVADKVCFVSESEKKAFEEYYEYLLIGKTEVVYNGINFDKFENTLPLTHPMPTYYPQSVNAIKMIMVGNFVKGRDQRFLCEVLNGLHDRGLSYEMYFVGQKSAAEPWRMEECVEACHKLPEVHFLGGRSDVPALLQEVDVCLYCTHHDTFGIAIIEPLLVGIPTIVNDYIVAREVTNNGEWASLYKTGDIDDCIAKIQDVINHFSQVKHSAVRNIQVIKQKYSIEIHINRLNEIYATLN